MKRNKKKYPTMKRVSPYMTGILGMDIRLSLWMRIKILFSGGVTLFIVGSEVARSHAE